MDRTVIFILLGAAYIVGVLSGVFSCCLMVASGRYHEQEEQFIGRKEDESQGHESPEDDQRRACRKEPE